MSVTSLQTFVALLVPICMKHSDEGFHLLFTLNLIILITE